MSKVLIAGYGSAGQYVVDFLLKDHRIREEDLCKIYIMSRKTLEEVTPRLEISRVSAGISGRYIPLEYFQCNFEDINGMSEVIEEIKPDVIVYTGRYASGIKYGAFSYPHDIGYGVWIPMSVPYIRNLMKAVQLTSVASTCKVVNTSFPDGVNMLLSQNGLAPYCGAGNLNHLIPRIKRVVSSIYSVNPGQVDVKLIGSHYLNTYVSKEGTDRGCPSSLNFSIDGKNISVDDKIKSQIYRECKDNSASGSIRNQMIASDCAEIVRLLVDKSLRDQTIHIPGLKGLPGGCPVTCTHGNFCVDSEDLALSVEINTVGLRCDGVVINHGGVMFTESVRKKMKIIYDLDYPSWIHLEEIESLADKIRDKLSDICIKTFVLNKRSNKSGENV